MTNWPLTVPCVTLLLFRVRVIRSSVTGANFLMFRNDMTSDTFALEDLATSSSKAVCG